MWRRSKRSSKRDEGQAKREATTGSELLKLVGRGVLWLTVAVLLLRGASDVLAGPEPEPRPQRVSAAASFPDDAARAFAADFAYAYLTYSPSHPEYHERATGRFLTPELRQSAALEVPDSGPVQTVDHLAVARAERLGPDRALITVAATVVNSTVTVRHLTVPVARDDAGGLAVYDYPSFSAPTAHASVEEEEVDELEDDRETAEIEAVLGRFFAAYLAGRSDDLDYFLPAGTHIDALGEPYRLRELVSLALLEGEEGERQRTVLVTLRARDLGTKAVYVLRYRVGLERRDRWYVASVNTNQGR